MKRITFKICLLLIVSLLGSLLSACSKEQQKTLLLEDVITQAFLVKKELSKDQEIVFILYDIEIDHIQIADDKHTAEIWFAMIDPDTGEKLATEPGIALAFLISDDPYSPNSWKITLHHESDWTDALLAMPDALMSSEDKQLLLGNTQNIPHDAQSLSGYKLPWPQGRAVKLSGSIAHVLIYKTCPTTCLYAFDFWDGTMFPVSAARGGVVKKAVWEFPNGNTTDTNYILIEDTSTTPTTYQIYYHLAQDSIPAALRTPGALVKQGQFIGNADDTGASTAHHLHFMVHTNPNSYWGTSVDITFDEVTMNGGRPRTCKETNQYPEYGSECVTGDWFVSQNSISNPPSIQMLAPNSGITIKTQTVMVAAQATSLDGIQGLTFFYRQGAQNWQTFASFTDSNIASADLDFCQWGVSDGSVEFAVEAVDSQGKKSDTKLNPVLVTKSFTCPNQPLPKCIPAADQVSLFTGYYFQGDCAIVPIGDYPSMDYIKGIDNDRVRSILVGNDAFAILYVSTNLKGSQESFVASDPDLRDNPTGIDSVSSVKVINFPDAPNTLILPNDFIAVESDNLVFTWQSDAESYRAEILVNDEVILSRDWDSATSWSVGNLSEGEYSFHVIGKNLSGSIEANTSFTIKKTLKTQPVTQLNPLPSTNETNLIHLQWAVIQGETNIAAFQIEMKQNDGEWLSISDTLPSNQRTLDIIGNPGKTYQFRLRALAIEGNSEAWSVLAQTQTTIALSCNPDASDSIPNGDNSPNNAVSAAWFKSQEHNICGPGDQDWLVFSAKHGQALKFQLESKQEGLTLLGEIYTGNDFENPIYQITDTDTWAASADGTYYLKIEATNPIIGGTDSLYHIVIEPAGLGNLLYIICLPLTALIAAMMGISVKKGITPKKIFRKYIHTA